GQRRPLCQRALLLRRIARHRALGRHLQRLAIGEELALLVGIVARLVAHVVATGEKEGDQRQEQPHSGSSVDWIASTRSGSSDWRKAAVSAISKRGSLQKMARKKRSALARWKSVTPKTGWCRRGRWFSTSMPAIAKPTANSTISSKVISMKG